jgi:GTPase SAR1 family protein
LFTSKLGVDFQVKTIRVDERNIAIQLWDTAGIVKSSKYI